MDSFLLAQAASGGGSGSSDGTALFLVQILPLLLVFVVFYFLLIRPQQKRMKEHRSMIDAVKAKDMVVTAGGLVGKVTKVEDAHVEVEIAPSVRVKVVKATLSSVTPFGTKPAND